MTCRHFAIMAPTAYNVKKKLKLNGALGLVVIKY